MKVKKRLGIWMDHTVARLMEYAAEDFKVTTVEVEFTPPANQQSLLRSESTLHNKENQSLKSYYKGLMNHLKNYDEVVLFGPTDAKIELFNLIRTDHRFDGIHLDIKTATKMSYEQQHEFIQNYFANLLDYKSPYIK